MPDDFGKMDFGDMDFGDFDATEAKKRSASGRTEELSDLLKKLKQRAVDEQAVFMENVDSEYWCCLCFQTRAQKEEFLQRIGWAELGDKYLDGVAVAEKHGMKLENKTPPVRKRNISKVWNEFTGRAGGGGRGGSETPTTEAKGNDQAHGAAVGGNQPQTH